MRLLDRFFPGSAKQLPSEPEVAGTVPLSYNPGLASYPDANFSNFASEGYGKNEVVYSCIRELATGAATPRYYVQAPATDGGMVEVTTGLLADLLERPNYEDDWYVLIEKIVKGLSIAGNAYLYKERSRGNQVTALYFLRPDWVRIVPGKYGAEGYVYEVDGKGYPVAREDMCHLYYSDPSGGMYGLSPLSVLARTVNLDISMTDFAKVFFANAGVPSGLLKLKRRLTNQEEAATVRSRWRSTFGGPTHFHKVAILDEDADYQQMAAAPKDMALTELHDLTESRICSVFGVPPILIGANVGLQRSTFSNYREARLSFHSETLEPLVTRILRYFNRNLFDEYPGNERLTVDWSAMRAALDDKADQTNRTTTSFNAGIITLNEAREELGYDAITEGDVRRIPATVFEVGEGGGFAPVAVGADPLAVEQAQRLEEVKIPALERRISSAGSSDFVEEKAPRVAPRGVTTRRRLLEDREAETDALLPQLQRHFRGIRNRVDGILGRLMERGAEETKDYPFDADDLLPRVEVVSLSEILQRSATRVSRKTFDTINESGVAGNLDWDERLPVVQSAITAAPLQAQIIHSTTNRTIARAITIGLENGYSISQLARGVPDDNFPGLRSILTETESRARTIARTEVMRTQNQTSIGFYETQGFNFLRADDVDGDEDDNYIDPGDPYGRTCRERHNQIYTVAEAANINDHPNGTLNWQPMPRNYRPEETI